MPDGHFLLVLHAHLPWVRHPEDPFFLEEQWLVEAITESYIPILSRLEQLHRDGVRARVTMTWSPPLCEMLADPLLQERYRQRVGRLLELAELEVAAKSGSPFAAAATMYRDHYRFCLSQLERFGGNVLGWVRHLRDLGVIEPITCTATHGFLPLMHSIEARRAQIEIAVANYTKHFGEQPRGMWLAECGYVPGVEDLLKEAGIRFFFVETHGLYFGEPRPRYGVYAPCYTTSGVAAFARDPEGSRSVWSSESGYPGDGLYREFYRDLGYDGDYEWVKAFLHPDGVRRNLGLKYHRITGKLALHEKQPYNPAAAHAKAMEHAGDFHYHRVNQAQWLGSIIERPPLLVCPYDCELFGHWWYEGPQFIESVFRCAQNHGHRLLPVNGSEYLDMQPVHQVVTPSASSWGDAGYNGVWINPANDWLYRHLHACEERMIEVARTFPAASGDLKRALDQMGRELLLAQSSDWAFIMTTGTTVAYAVRRTKDHVNRFTGLYEMVMGNRIDPQILHEIAWRDTIFSEIDYRVWA
ncbi:MAG: 1,4-alpha-glucan branching protein domain-containing protein [Planctomycetota bacterium]